MARHFGTLAKLTRMWHGCQIRGRRRKSLELALGITDVLMWLVNPYQIPSEQGEGTFCHRSVIEIELEPCFVKQEEIKTGFFPCNPGFIWKLCRTFHMEVKEVYSGHNMRRSICVALMPMTFTPSRVKTLFSGSWQYQTLQIAPDGWSIKDRVSFYSGTLIASEKLSLN